MDEITTIVKGLKDHLGVEIIRSNQTGYVPAHPYGSFSITSVSANNGTYEEYEDGTARSRVVQSWSLTFQSDDYTDALGLAMRARQWVEYLGRTYLNDNGVIIGTVGSITSRDNFITIEYEYRCGFDFTVLVTQEVQIEDANTGYIEKAQFTKIPKEES